MDSRLRKALDQYITGNYGEDQFRRKGRNTMKFVCNNCEASFVDPVLDENDDDLETCPECGSEDFEPEYDESAKAEDERE